MKLWKFLVPLTLCLVLAVLFLPTTANAASSGTCGDNLTWTLDDAGTPTISGTGPMKDYTYSSSAPWYSNRSSVKKVVIEDGVTTVGSYAFSSYSSLTSVMIPDSVTTISSSAFYDHDNRPSIWVRENNSNYSSDSQGVLFNKDKTTLIQAPSTLTGRYMIPDSVTIIESSAFRSCYGLASVTIPDSVTYINNNAFNNCTRLTSVTIGNGVTTIGGDAFYPCSRLTDVWYTGSQSDRNKISIGSYNSYLTSATWHYNSCWGSAMHTYDHACDTDCNVCGKTRTTTHTYNNNCDTDCNVCGYTRTITHKYQWVIDQQENCGVDGIKHEECTVCHVKRNEGTKIPATNAHTYGAWKNNAQDHWKECAVCGGIAQQQSHNYTNSCDTTCNICSYTRTITHQYAWVTTATSHRQKCEVCSKEIDVADHSYDNTCDTVCDVCGYTRAITHTYDNDCDTICNVCNLERTVPAHSYTLNGNHTCDICKYSKTPGKPVVENKTNSSVTLVKTEGFEYSKDGKTWQASNEFTSLAPDTTYTFYQRVKASSTALVSEMSEGMSVTFKSAQAAPSAPVFSSFTDTTLTLIPITGGEYSVDGKTWQTDSVFDDLTPGAKYTVYQRYAETATHEASNSTGTTVTMDKSKQTQIPDAPTVESVTAYSVTLNAVEGCEYSKDGKTWQKSNTFSGLACGVEYTFYQRYAENATHYAGKASQSITAKTDKGNQSKPSAPTLAKKTYNSVTLTVRTGYEYSRDGINWQASNVFTGLAPETNYFFYQRKAETATHYASEISPSLIVKTNEEPDYIPGDLNGNEQLTTDDAVYLLLSVMFGAEDYPVPNGMPLDFNSDSKLDTNDAVYLLLHVMFGAEDYPLSA